MRIVDFHNHYYPPEYVATLAAADSRAADLADLADSQATDLADSRAADRADHADLRRAGRSPDSRAGNLAASDAATGSRGYKSTVRVTYDKDGNPCVHYPGDYNILVPGHRDIEYRQRVIDEHGVSTQVLSFTTPGVHVEPPEAAVTLARAINDAFARETRARGGRFTALATLPLNDPAASVLELERAMTGLRLPGTMVFSNVNHVPLDDERFEPLWKKADDLGAVVYIHPTDPRGVEGMLDYWLMPLVGFLLDTTLAASRLVFSGVVERHPRIRWVLTHMGGAIPYLAERLDRGYRAFVECRRHISRPPSEYLRQFYYDTVNFNDAAVRLALDFAGEDRILAGSDYPHQIGSIPLMIETIRTLDVAERVKRKIFAENADHLLHLA